MKNSITDKEIRAIVRKALPADAFRSRPLHALWLVPMVGVAAACIAAIILLPMPWFIKLILGIVAGNVYGSLFFFGHYLLHGSMVRSTWLQDLLMFPCTMAIGLSPHLWRVWHHYAHHPFANQADGDPDHFGTYEKYGGSRHGRLFIAILPGNARWFRSLVYLTTFFTVHIQGVLWLKSRQLKGFHSLNRPRAIAETAFIYGFWLAIAWICGPIDTIFAVLVPWLVGNAVTLSYILTQHLLRPLGSRSEVLSTTMSLTVSHLADRVHWYNSHHVEHHLFPTLPYSMLPCVREILLRHCGPCYLAPPFYRALLAVLLTPRLHDGDCLVDPESGRRVSFSQINQVLLGKAPLGSLYPSRSRQG